MTLTVRDFTAGDQAEVRELVLQGLGDHWGTIEAWRNPDLDDIAASYAGGRTVVVEHDGVIVATGTLMPLEEGVAEVVRMSVVRADRRGGLGRAVLNELVATARAWGMAKVILETTSAWTEVVSFYVACGFRIAHTDMTEYGDATWFELVIGEAP
ncbi:MAG: GNAT family N-acetyltransferase [Actinomycetota bacterium]|nr:GNAT family N-acetyltransferase [Actinomycetota bacterium]